MIASNGKIVGINTRGIQGQALNFAIPIDTAKPVIDAILKTAADSAADAVRGHVDRADLGIDFKPLQDLESFYNVDINHGALVNSVDRGSPAAKAGIKPQDIILSMNGQPTNIRFPEELAAVRSSIASFPIGQSVNVALIPAGARNKTGGETKQVTVVPVKLESAVGDEKEIKGWGLSVRDVTRAFANDRQLDDDLGVVVTSLSKGGVADKGELAGGDVIRAINGKPVTDLAEFLKLYEGTRKARLAKVLVQVARDRGFRDEVLKVTYPATTATAPATQP